MQNDGTKRDLENVKSITPPALRGLAEMRAYLHGYRIRNGGNLRRTTRASIIISAIDNAIPTLMARRAARELAALDPETFHWLPTWKPRMLASEVV